MRLAPGQGCPVPVPLTETKETGLKANGNYMPIGCGIIVARPTPAKGHRPPWKPTRGGLVLRGNSSDELGSFNRQPEACAGIGDSDSHASRLRLNEPVKLCATGHESGTAMLLERGSQPAREFVLDQVKQARPEVIEVTDQILGQLRELAASRVLAADLGVDQGCA